jgi:hypothetical protein
MVPVTTDHPRRASANFKEKADLGTLLTLPFKIVIGIIKKVVIGIPMMIAKSLIMAILMALIPIIVIAAAIYWFVTTQL